MLASPVDALILKHFHDAGKPAARADAHKTGHCGADLALSATGPAVYRIVAAKREDHICS
jgi:hypothetical protein